MPAAAWMTIAVAGLIIAVTAVGLIRIVFHLRAIRGTLAAAGGARSAQGFTIVMRAARMALMRVFRRFFLPYQPAAS